MDYKEEQKLVKKAIKGNKKSFERLVKQHYERIYRTAYIYVNNQEDALDVVQDATYQAFISIHSLKHPEYFMTWLTKIIIRCAGQVVKKRGTVIPFSDEILIGMIPQSEEKKEVDCGELMDALAQIKENYRTSILLFYYHDYSIKTISTIMQIPEGTVKTYLSRGKEALKKILNEEGFDHGRKGFKEGI